MMYEVYKFDGNVCEMDAKMQTNISLKFFSNPFDKRENGEFFLLFIF
jgi:hypothetical protein